MLSVHAPPHQWIAPRDPPGRVARAARKFQPPRRACRISPLPEGPLNILLLLVGITLVVVAILDAAWTALWVEGRAGFVTARLTPWAWRCWLALVGPRRRLLLSLFGPSALAGSLLLWVTLLWVGWVLTFAASEHALVGSRTGVPADWTDRIYFVGYAMSTMGNGDFSPTGDPWQIATALTTLSGLGLVTLGISYMVSVLAAVVSKRDFASQVSGLGTSAGEILRLAWDGRDFHALDRTLHALATSLVHATELHLAYPMLRYYQASHRRRSLAVSVAVLDDALTLLCFATPAEVHPNPVALRSARSAVGGFLETLRSASVEPADQPPPAPSLHPLREAGIPTVDPGEFAAALHALRDRRRKLLGLVQHDGWGWEEDAR